MKVLGTRDERCCAYSQRTVTEAQRTTWALLPTPRSQWIVQKMMAAQSEVFWVLTLSRQSDAFIHKEQLGFLHKLAPCSVPLSNTGSARCSLALRTQGKSILTCFPLPPSPKYIFFSCLHPHCTLFFFDIGVWEIYPDVSWCGPFCIALLQDTDLLKLFTRQTHMKFLPHAGHHCVCCGHAVNKTD